MILAKKPPMGWNSWNTFGPEISKSQFNISEYLIF